MHSLLATTVPFVTFSAYSTEFEFQHSIKLSGATRLFVSPTLLHLAQVSSLPDDCIYILEGNVEGRTSYATLVDRVRQTKIPRLPVRPAKKDTLAYLVFSSGTTGLPKGERAFLNYRIFVVFSILRFSLILNLVAVMITHGNLISAALQFVMLGEEFAKVQDVSPSPSFCNVFCLLLRVIIASNLERARWLESYTSCITHPSYIWSWCCSLPTLLQPVDRTFPVKMGRRYFPRFHTQVGSLVICSSIMH